MPFGRTELSIRLWTPSRAFFNLGMVPGAVFFKGRGKGSSFGIIFWFLPGRTKIEKIKMSQKWVSIIPKDAARLGDLGKRVFGPKFPTHGGTNGFSFWGFSGFPGFPDFLVFSLRLGPPAKEMFLFPRLDPF